MSQTSEPDDRVARFERLFRTHYAVVAGYIGRRTEAEMVDDLVDDVFLVAWRRLDQMPQEARPWLLAVARNVLGTHFRGARRSRALNVRLAANQVDAWGPAQSHGDQAFSAHEIAAALAALRPKDREALLLVNWEALTPSQAAAALGDTATAFRVRLHRARSRFRAALEKPEQQSATLAPPRHETAAPKRPVKGGDAPNAIRQPRQDPRTATAKIVTREVPNV